MKDGSTYIHMEGTARNDYSTTKFNPRKGPAAPAHERACTEGTKYGKNIHERSRLERLGNTHVPERWDRKVLKKILADDVKSKI